MTYPKTTELWAKLSPSRRVALHTACDVLINGNSIAGWGGSISANDSLERAERLTDDVQSLRESNRKMVEELLTERGQQDETGVFRFIVAITRSQL